MTTITITRDNRTSTVELPDELADRMAAMLTDWRRAALSGVTTDDTRSRANDVHAVAAALIGSGPVAARRHLR